MRGTFKHRGLTSIAFISTGAALYAAASLGAGCTSEVRDFGGPDAGGGSTSSSSSSSSSTSSSTTSGLPTECIPGGTMCKNDTILEICDDSGQWSTAANCVLGCDYNQNTCIEITKMSLGDGHSCALLSDGNVRCWGSAEYGQVGEGSTGNGAMVLKPTLVMNLSNTIDIDLGPTHTCAVAAEGSDASAYCWGHNGFYKLGDGTLQSRAIPTKVVGLAGIPKSIALGGSHTCAILTDSSVQCWGSNQYGQIGNGTTMDAKSPATAGPLQPAAALSLGERHTCALMENGGTIWCWGDNYSGALGNGMSGANTNKTKPIESVPYINFQISLSLYASHALLADGTVSGWGANLYGQLGNGNTQDQSNPVIAKGIGSAIAVAAGGLHACALLADGHVLCWGSNDQGQLGNGAAGGSQSAPAEVIGVSGAIGVAAGIRHTCAWFAGGTAVCWGQNNAGQLGDGSSGGSKTIPTAVAF